MSRPTAALRDNTCVIEMMKEFDVFLGKAISDTSNRSIARSNQRSPAPKFNLDQSMTSTVVAETTPNRDLKRKLIEKEIEVHKIQAELGQLKRSSTSQHKMAENAIQTEKDAQLYKSKYECERENSSRLRTQLKLLESDHDSMAQLNSEKFGKLEDDLSRLTVNIKLVKKENTALQDALNAVKLEKNGKIEQLRTEIIELNGELAAAKAELKYNEEHSVPKSTYYKYEEEMENERVRLETMCRELQDQICEHEESDTFVQAMKSAILNQSVQQKECVELKDENSMLKCRVENTLLLKDKLAALESERAKQAKGEEHVLQLETTVHNLQCKLEQWEALGENWAAVHSRLSRLHKNEILLKEEIGIVRTELESCKLSKSRLEHQIVQLEKSVDQHKTTQENSVQFLRKLQRRQLLLRRQCEGYQRLITSYESEMTIDVSVATNHNRDRIAALETLVEEYKNMLDQECGGGVSLIEEKKQRDAENEALKVEIAQLKSLLPSNNNRENYRVLHFRDNPANLVQVERTKEQQLLREENDRLKAKIQVLIEKQQRHDADMTTSSLMNVTQMANQRLEAGGNDAVRALQEQLSKCEEKNKRFVEAFKTSSQEFRETCYLLTGYKLDIIKPKKYRLTHVLAESPDDHLIFQMADGKIELMETEYSRSISSLIQEYLCERDCIPAFLSCLTMELFQRQTMIG